MKFIESQILQRIIKKQIFQNKLSYSRSCLFSTKNNSFKQQDLNNFENFNKLNDKEDQKKYNNQNLSLLESIISQRREQDKYLKRQEQKMAGIQTYTDACIDLIIEFQLYMKHTCYKCQYLDAVMNYHKISYKRNMNPYYHDRLMISFPYLKKKEYPFLRVHISLEPVKFFSGYEEIEKYLIQQDFIRNPKHKTNAAFSQIGVEFAQKQVYKQLEILFWNPILTFENLLKSFPETYRQNVRQYVLLKVLRELLQNIFVQIFKNIFKIMKNKQEYKESKLKTIQLMEDWKIMLQNHNFHGGKEPNEADFALYGVLKCFYNSKSFQKFIENKFPSQVYKWFIRMQQICIYTEDRELYN